MGSWETIYGAPPNPPPSVPRTRSAMGREAVRACAVWMLALKRATLQTFSPCAARSFFSNLDDHDPLLSRLGWVLLCVVPMFALLGYFVPGTVHTVNPWVKPIKFSISFATYGWSASLFFLFLKLPSWQATLARRATAVSVIVEMVLLGMQAWRNAQPYPISSFPDLMISHAVTVMVSVNTVVMVWMLVLCCGNRAWMKSADRTLVIAIRDSIVIFLVGNAVGGYMLARGSHTVGAPDGGRGLTFVNWSVIAGDLRIAHFIAVHAIQIVPLFAYLLLQMAPRPALKQRKLAVLGMSAGVMLVVLATFIQAALGHPLVSLGR